MSEPKAPKPWEKLRLRAADQTAATFVNPDGGIEVFQRDALGDQQQRALAARGLKPATPEDIERRAKFLEHSTTEQQTRAALDLATTTATFGAIGKEDLDLPSEKGRGEADARRAAFEQASPTVALGARVVGSAIPMALTGGAAGALGAGAAAVGAAEGVGAALAEENADAAWHNRPLNAGNIAIAGLGGALFGAAIPAVLRRGSKALAGPADAVAAAAGEVGENVGVQLEAKAAARAAGNVDKIPPGPARDALLVRNAPQHLEQVQSEVSDVVTRAPAALEKSDIDKATLKRLMPKDAPNQTQWATDTAEELRALAAKQSPPASTVAATEAAAEAPLASVAANDTATPVASEIGGKPKVDTDVAPHIPDEPPIEAPPASGIRANPEELGFIPHSKSGRRSIKRYESDMARIEGMTPEERVKFDDLLKEHAAVSRISPFGPGNKAKLYELQKDIIEEYGDLFPKRKAPSGTPAAPTSPAPPAAAPSGNPLRDAAASLLESKGALDTMQRARGALRDLRAAGAPQEAIDALQKGISDQALFGRAAEAVADFDAAHARVPNGALEGFDPGNLTQASREKLTAMAEALEDRAAARAKWDIGGAKDKESQRLLGDASRIRKNLGLADDVAGATGRAEQAATKPVPKESAGRSFMKDAAAEVGEMAVEHIIGHAIPGAGLALKGARYLWSNVDASGKAAINAAARNVARGAMGAAERASAALGKVAPTALQSFSEGFPGPQEAFAARSAMLADMVRDPTVLPNAMAESFGDLPRENPKLFQQMATRMARATQYVTANLPVGIATSLAYPRGVPPSQSSLREFAVVWNSAMDPGSVIDAVASGSATPSQVRTLQSVDPDVYQSLTQAVTQEVGNNYAQMPAQTKQWLDILFQSDGIAGPGFSWKAATYMSEGEKKNPRQPMPMGKLPPPSQQAPEARGISAIQRGVTNAG